LKADPAKAAAVGESLSAWPGNSRREMEKVKEKLAGLVGSGQLGIFTNGYWGHPAMKLPPEVNLLAVAHYLQALEYQRKANQVVAILGGKTPNIQNLAVGGVANAINLDNAAALNMQKLAMVRDLLLEVQAFVTQVYLPDVCAIAGLYPEWLGYGAGVRNYLAVPDLPLDTTGKSFAIPGGTIWGGDLSTLTPITSFNDAYFRDGVAESVAHAWYVGDKDLHPFDGETVPHYTDFDPKGKYSWSKAPRFHGKPMQLGPTAVVLSALQQGHEPTKRWAGKVLETAGSIAKTKLTPAVLESTLGRHAARVIRSAVLAETALQQWQLLVDNLGKGDFTVCNPPVFPKGEIRGVGFHEAPRGSLSHWVVIENGKIKNYQAVVPSTWNAGPRDSLGQLGPYEASLVGNPIADPNLPLEALRTVHSFDPCLACAVHMVDVEGHELSRVRVL
jgi:hydrogenase large subunit